VLPAALVGAAVWLVLRNAFGLFAVPCASAAATAVIAVEFRLAVGLLGKLFDRFDVTLP